MFKQAGSLRRDGVDSFPPLTKHLKVVVGASRNLCHDEARASFWPRGGGCVGHLRVEVNPHDQVTGDGRSATSRSLT